MPSDLVSGPISKISLVGPKALWTNQKFFESFPFLPKSFKYHNYIIINYFGSIRELKSLKHAFSKNLSKIFFRNATEGSRILRTSPELPKHPHIIIINSYLSIHSPKHRLRKSRILPETHIIFRIDLIYSDYIRILPITQIQHT